MNNYSIAIILYGETKSNKNAYTEEKYKGIVTAFTEKGFQVDSIIYKEVSNKMRAKL